jgi:hypothetical protein
VKPTFFNLLLIIVFFCPLVSWAQGWQWAVSSNGYGGGNNVTSIATDLSGNVFITGSTSYAGNTFGTYLVTDSTNHDGEQIFVAKMDHNGNFLWAVGSYAKYYGAFPLKVATDLFGNCYLFGTYSTN